MLLRRSGFRDKLNAIKEGDARLVNESLRPTGSDRIGVVEVDLYEALTGRCLFLILRWPVRLFRTADPHAVEIQTHVAHEWVVAAMQPIFVLTGAAVRGLSGLGCTGSSVLR